MEPLAQMHDEGWLIQRYEALPPEQRQEYALISLKIKRFRTFNRLFGRQAGDELIWEVYQAIQTWLEPGEYVAQIHLDYFNLLVRVPNDYEAIFQRIIHLNRHIRDMPDPRFSGKVFSGMGVYHLKAEAESFEIAQYNADVCRAECPERDFRNSHMEVYGLSYQDPNLRYFDLRQAIKPALDNGDFKLYLQPKVDLRTGEITKAEALVRWIDPEKGMIPLSDFLPGLEENGLISEVDAYLFLKVCQCIQDWIDRYGKKIQISVNLSSCAFNYLYFMEDYKRAYQQCPAPKDCIRFELLEGSVLNKVERVRQVVGELREFGFTCALDDFGSGFSNFNVLTTKGFSELKIDRSLFRDERDARERTVLRHIIESGHELGMKIVAEGVETQGYVDYLRQEGCDFIQGFVFYRPMPVEEFEERFLRKGERVALT